MCPITTNVFNDLTNHNSAGHVDTHSMVTVTVNVNGKSQDDRNDKGGVMQQDDS